MANRQRLLINVAVSYVVVSAILFGIFVFTYRGYWYRIQEQMIVTRSRQNEKIFLNAIAEAFHSASKVVKVKREVYESDMKWVAQVRLMDLIHRFEELSKPIISDSIPVESPANTPFIEPETEARERLKKLLQPVKPAQDEEKPFLEILDKFNEDNKGRIVIKRFAPGYDQMVDMSLIAADSKDFKLSVGGKTINWELRAYVEPYREGKVSNDAILERFMQQDPISTKRLGIYAYGVKKPLYVGSDHQLDAGKLEYFESKASKQSSAFFESPEPSKVNGVYEGEDVTQILLNSFYTDSELRLTFVLNKVINEPEWTQFGFWDRNKVPILFYVILAWVVCPLLFWFGVNKSNRFQFQLTANLDGEDDELSPLYDAQDQAESEVRQTKITKNVELPKVKTETPRAENSADLPKENYGDIVLSEKTEKVIDPKSHKEQSDRALGPLTRRLQEEQIEKMSVEKSSKSDVELIRLNNIRKSSGSFNRHAEEGEKADFLAGVQSDVLKSLIKKLRDD